MVINAEWHRAHRMPKNATPQQRLDWHVAHAKACRCRTLTPAQLKALKAKARAGLGQADVIAFVPTTDMPRSRRFFEGTLGLAFVSEDPFALVFDANGTTLRVANVASVAGFKPAAFTVLGWSVADADAAVDELSRRGVTFERFPGMNQDERGIWNSPSGARIAWFKDPEGNILSITEH